MKDYLSQFIADYINGPDPYQAGPTQLMQELREFGTKQDTVFSGHKAHRLYVKALVRKKVALANRIKAKYGDLFPRPRPTDATLAAGIALMAASKHQP